MSTPASRAAKRDYWNRPTVIARCKALDWAGAITATFAFAVIGSLNF
jgi:hypothetical protein